MDAEISKQGILPMVAPVKPYTLLADTLSASWRPSSTAFVKGSVAAFRSAFALRTMHHTGFKAQGSGRGRQRRLRRILPPGPGSAPRGLQIKTMWVLIETYAVIPLLIVYCSPSFTFLSGSHREPQWLSAPGAWQGLKFCIF